MQKLLVIAWNHIRLEFQDRSTIVFFLILPIVFTIVTGSALGYADMLLFGWGTGVFPPGTVDLRGQGTITIRTDAT